MPCKVSLSRLEGDAGYGQPGHYAGHHNPYDLQLPLRIEMWTVTARQEPRYSCAAMLTLPDDLDAFYLEHRRCGELEAEISEGEAGWVMMACSCGGQLARRLARSGAPAPFGPAPCLEAPV